MAADMASQNMTPASPPAALIGNAFVEQYYNILHLSPEMAHRFYQDTSILGHPDLDGIMSSVTTMQAIDERVMSLNYKDCKFEIETVDSQHSYKDGVIVLVTGCLVGKDNIRRKFTQSFFLAPQDKGGYFVLNDVFRYVVESQTKEDSNLPEDATRDFATNTAASINLEEHIENSGEVLDQVDDGISVVEEEPDDQPDQSSQQDVPPASELTTAFQEDTPKKSYASIVKVTKGISAPSPIYVPAAKAKVTIEKTEKQAPAATPVPAPEAASPSKNDAHESTQEEVEGYSIYVRNLPLNATPPQVEEEFKKFGPIKPGGVQVRNHRQYGYCFGFVEYESESSMRAAIEAAPVMMGNHRVIVEVKRTATRVVDGGNNNTGGRGQFPQARGGFRIENRFRNDNIRGRGGFNTAPTFVRNEFRSRGGFSGRGRGPLGRGSGLVYHNGGRTFRPTGGLTQLAVPA